MLLLLLLRLLLLLLLLQLLLLLLAFWSFFALQMQPNVRYKVHFVGVCGNADADGDCVGVPKLLRLACMQLMYAHVYESVRMCVRVCVCLKCTSVRKCSHDL